MVDNYTKAVLTVIAIGIVALNIKLWNGSVVGTALADDIQKVEIVGPTTGWGYVKVQVMNQ